MPDFTKGPWEVEKDALHPFFYVSKEKSKTFLATVNNDANARLIATAPDMYKILCDIREWCQYDDLDADIEDDIAEVLKAVDGRENN